MITAERLEELIKQRAKVWDEFWHEEVQLDPSSCYIKGAFNVGKYNLFVEEDEEHCPSYYLDNLREDWERAKAEYEWKEKTTAERTERFEPPMWEDIENEYKFFFIHNEDYYCFYVNKNHNEIDLIRNEFYYELGDGDDEATKENYIKACEIVRDLFNKGGSK